MRSRAWRWPYCARDDGEDSSMALPILGFTGSALDESSRAHHRTLGVFVMLMAEVCWKTMQRDMTGTQSKTSHPNIPLLLLFLLIMRHSSQARSASKGMACKPQLPRGRTGITGHAPSVKSGREMTNNNDPRARPTVKGGRATATTTVPVRIVFVRDCVMLRACLGIPSVDRRRTHVRW